MRSQITTTITTTIDLETFSPEHKVEIDAEDDLPREVIMAAVQGACRATLNTIVKQRGGGDEAEEDGS